METNILAWFCEALELPVLRENGAGGVAPNALARQYFRQFDSSFDGPQTLVSTIERVLAGDMDRSRLSAAIELARLGTPQSLDSSEGERVILLPQSSEQVAATIAPASFQNIHKLQTRAAITDRAAGVSHELANSLGAIAGWARLAQAGQRVPEALDSIERGAEDARATARNFLFDAGTKAAAPSEPIAPLNLSELLREVQQLIAPLAVKNQVRVISDVADNVAVVATRSAAWTILWNLATNAVEAMSTGGTLQMSLSAVDNHAVVTIQDNGEGISDSVQERIFEPYFTTKSQGAGVGLSLVRKTVDSLGGDIAVQTAQGTGTLFRIRLPQAIEQVPTSPKRKRTSGVFMTEQLDGRFLVIDDDSTLREMVATALEMRGAEVVAVADAETALATPGPFDAAVVDLLLDSTRGDALIAELRRRNIVQTALLVTGTEVPQDLVSGGTPDSVLRKPFDLDVLFSTLHNLTSSATTSRDSQSA